MKDNNLDKSLNLIAKSAIIVFIFILLSKIFAYVYRIVIAREFGPSTYGVYSLAVMISGWLIVFSGLGLGEGIVRYISIYRSKNQVNKIQSIFRSSSLFLLLTTVTFGAVLFFFAETISVSVFRDPNLIIFLKFFAIIIPLTVFLNAFLRILQAYEKIGLQSFISDFLLNFLKVALVLIFIYLGFSSNAIILSFVLGTFGALLAALVISGIKIPEIFKKTNLKFETSLSLFLELFSYSWPFLFTRVLQDVLKWTDTFFIGYFETSTSVGIYNAAMPIAFLLTFPTMIFMRLFYPLINREYYNGNKKEVRELSKQVGKWIFILSFPLFFLVILFPGVFLNVLFGEEYIAAKTALIVLSFGFLFSSVFTVSGNILAMLGKSKTIMIDSISAFILNIILNILLIPKYGITGAAIATVISMFLLYSALFFQSYLYTKIIPLRRKMIVIMIATAIPSILILYLRNLVSEINLFSLSIFAIFFITLYVLLILTFRGFDKNDIEVIKTIIKKIKMRVSKKND